MHNILSTTDVFSKVTDCKNLTAEIRLQYDDSFFQKIDEYLGAIEYGKTEKEELEDSDDYDSDGSDDSDSDDFDSDDDSDSDDEYDETYIQVKSLYISPAMSHFYETKYDIWAGWQHCTGP